MNSRCVLLLSHGRKRLSLGNRRFRFSLGLRKKNCQSRRHRGAWGRAKMGKMAAFLVDDKLCFISLVTKAFYFGYRPRGRSIEATRDTQ